MRERDHVDRPVYSCNRLFIKYFFFNDTATTEIYTLSLHDALPIYVWLLPVQSADVSQGFDGRSVLWQVRRPQRDDLSGDHFDHLWRVGSDVLCREERRRCKEAGRVFIGFVD